MMGKYYITLSCCPCVLGSESWYGSIEDQRETYMLLDALVKPLDLLLGLQEIYP